MILKVKTFTSMIMVHTVYDGVHHVLLDTIWTFNINS